MVESVGQFKALKGKGNHVYEHCVRVRDYSVKVCKKLKVRRKLRKEIGLAALYHDLGKVKWAQKFLDENYHFKPEDFELMKEHVFDSYRILKKTYGNVNWLEYVLYHHEKLDGSGYPKGLEGGEIPFGARIITVVDSYDAMFRHYSKVHESKTKKEVIEELKNLSELHFDKKVVEAFLKIVK